MVSAAHLGLLGGGAVGRDLSIHKIFLTCEPAYVIWYYQHQHNTSLNNPLGYHAPAHEGLCKHQHQP